MGGSGRFNRGIPEEVHNQLRKLLDLVVSHPLGIAGIQESAHGDHVRNPLCYGWPFQFHMGVGFCQTAVAEGQPGGSIGLVVIPTMIAAVFTMLLFQKTLPFFEICVPTEKGKKYPNGIHSFARSHAEHGLFHRRR